MCGLLVPCPTDFQSDMQPYLVLYLQVWLELVAIVSYISVVISIIVLVMNCLPMTQDVICIRCPMGSSWSESRMRNSNKFHFMLSESVYPSRTGRRNFLRRRRLQSWLDVPDRNVPERATLQEHDEAADSLALFSSRKGIHNQKCNLFVGGKAAMASTYHMQLVSSFNRISWRCAFDLRFHPLAEHVLTLKTD